MAESSKKATLRRVAGSFVNNAAAIEGAKFSPWWIGLIMFILGLLLPVLPLFVSAAKAEGTSFLASAEYGLGLDKTFGAAINELDGALTFDNTNKKITYTPNNASNQYSEVDSTLIGGYISTSGNYNGQYELRIYYSAIHTTEEEINDFITTKEKITYKKGTTTVSGLDDDRYTPSSIYFFSNGLYIDIYGANSTEKKAQMSFLSDLNCFDYADGDLKAYFVGKDFDKTNKDKRMDAFHKLEEFINVTYKTSKTKSMWLGSLLYLGIYAGVNFFMILMIFIMSRGKNNPNNYLNFWQCIKIDWWSSLCPGLLGMILGFIFLKNAVMIYVLLISMRTVWLTTREMRPQIQ